MVYKSIPNFSIHVVLTGDDDHLILRSLTLPDRKTL